MWIRVFFSFLATGSFAVIFNTPKKHIPFAALTGAIGWFFYEVFKEAYGFESGIIFASLSVGFTSYVMSKIFDTNVHPFITAGIIPLVPGATAFFTFQYFIQGNLEEASSYAYQTFVAAFGIVIGIAASFNVADLISNKLKSQKFINKKK
ncbi:threonine/serine exporter family protein [Oceanotoga sp. DSM 15011]|jgi:uncharacterized membrane protein YjjB (DUF3815 family)|uniref:Uncharacterized membrane protein YjjB (DUF3815 family) n=1 Tax=Oceanotoga teriensis TaxID=515440 RepID=A0AA45C809_9BACT|nr:MULTISPECIES: threonine/serine exporter family protein [Oceanotoga]MDN5341264.1 hypothetical protein [Oceanotoga sp.]MDO7977009.1 threonine/serine exporter family protein [Oceanotoga teriensis]PWJ95689.1 uncharacterized membrane protein YjjB (DUF3815 family) [Oceanotoga teriensis]UYO99523.1 threonine/serine exporter family protein [Oceanotoga sp. DSM 15011]